MGKSQPLPHMPHPLGERRRVAGGGGWEENARERTAGGTTRRGGESGQNQREIHKPGHGTHAGERERESDGKAAGQGGGKPSGGREGGKEISGGGGEEEDGAATPGCAPAAAVGQGVSWLYDNVRWEPSSPPTPTLPLSFTHSHTHTFIAAVDGRDKPPWQVSAHTHGGWSMRWCGHADVADGV